MPFNLKAWEVARKDGAWTLTDSGEVFDDIVAKAEVLGRAHWEEQECETERMTSLLLSVTIPMDSGTTHTFKYERGRAAFSGPFVRSDRFGPLYFVPPRVTFGVVGGNVGKAMDAALVYIEDHYSPELLQGKTVTSAIVVRDKRTRAPVSLLDSDEEW